MGLTPPPNCKAKGKLYRKLKNIHYEGRANPNPLTPKEDDRTDRHLNIIYQQHYGHVQNPKHFLSSPRMRGRMNDGTNEWKGRPSQADKTTDIIYRDRFRVCLGLLVIHLLWF